MTQNTPPLNEQRSTSLPISTLAKNQIKEHTLVIVTPSDPQGKQVLQGVFGELVSIDPDTKAVEVRLDGELARCSAIFTPYSGQATFKVHADEAVILRAGRGEKAKYAVDSIKATLTASLAQLWGKRYEALIEQMGNNPPLRQLLEDEMNVALGGAQALIDGKRAYPATLPISALTIADSVAGNITEVVLLKETPEAMIPLTQTLPLVNNPLGFTQMLLTLSEREEKDVYKHDGELNVLLAEGGEIDDVSLLLAQSDEALTLMFQQLGARLNPNPTMLAANNVKAYLTAQAASPTSHAFSEALDEYISSQGDAMQVNDERY